MYKNRSKKAQSTMSLPFGLIFSIILIIVFIVVAFIAVGHFLEIGDCSKVGQAYEELQEKVDEAWRSQISEFEISLSLPSGVDKICFANLSLPSKGGVKAEYDEIERYSVYEANTFLVPSGKTCDMPYKNIKHIDISEITKLKNPYCIEADEKILLKKGVYDKLVLIK
jgi:predicted RNase H-like HicB family nuclease